jgi:hypothetical protein
MKLSKNKKRMIVAAKPGAGKKRKSFRPDRARR